MTSYEMVSDLAGRLGDPSFERFTEQEMRHWLNVGQLDVQRRLNGLNAEWFLTQSSVSSYGTVEWYTLPADCRTLRSVRCEVTIWGGTGTGAGLYRWPRLKYIEQESEEATVDWEPSATDVRYYHIGTRVRLNPVPTSTVSNAVIFSYSRTVPDLSAWSDVESSGIRSEYHDLVVSYAEILARRREGTETAQLLMEYGQAFENLKASADVTVVGRK